MLSRIKNIKKYRKRLIREVFKRIILNMYEKKSFRQIVHFFHGPKTPQKWVFIVGCYNSGTTLLQRLIAAHPQITTLPIEGVQLTSYLPRPEWYGWTRMWCECIEKIEFLRIKDHSKAQKIIMDWSPFFNKNCPVFLEKSIANTTRIEWLEENFPNAYFIGIVRHPYAVASGIRKRSVLKGAAAKVYGHTYPIELTAKQWKVSNEYLFEASDKVENFTYIRYEDLIENPIAVLEKLFSFIHLPLPAMFFRQSELCIGQYTEKIANKNDENFSLVNRDEQEKIDHITQEIQKKLKYL